MPFRGETFPSGLSAGEQVPPRDQESRYICRLVGAKPTRDDTDT